MNSNKGERFMRICLICFLVFMARADENPVWIRTGGPLGGLGYDVRMRPDNPDLMYVTDAYAGVFISENGGRTWFPSNQGITTRGGDSGDAIPVFCLTIDPHQPDIIWAGTQFQRGIFKSVDAGQSWTEMDEGIQDTEGITFRGFTVDPFNSEVVYAAAELSSWNWNPEPLPGREFDLTMGVVYKTTDGGDKWTEIWRGNNLARYIWIHPENPELIYISTGIFDREAADSDDDKDNPGGEGIVRSKDGGKTWENINTGMENLYVGSLFMHPDNPEILLAGTGNNAYGSGQGIYLTENGGDSWEKVLENDNINAVEFCGSEPDIAYAGSASAIYRSEDRGRHWEKMTEAEIGWGAPGVRAGFPIDFQVDPRNANRIFANNYGGGNFLSEDGGKSWIVASQGYTGAQARDVAVHPEDPVRVYCAARSGLFVSANSGQIWEGLNRFPADMLEWNVVAVDPRDARHIVAGTNWNATLVESRQEGAEWRSRGPLLPPGCGFRSVVFAPSDPEIIYAGTSGFYSAGVFDPVMDAAGMAVSRNGGEDWEWINDTYTAKANVYHMAVDPSDPLVVFAATGNKGLLKTQDGGTSWDPVTAGLPAMLHFTMVAVDPHNGQRIFAAPYQSGLYRSVDGGTAWKMMTSGLIPEMKISDLIFDPLRPDVIYLSDLHSGVYRSDNGGDSWTPVIAGLRTRAVNALSISADGMHVYAATEGEGIFRLDYADLPVRVRRGAEPPGTFHIVSLYPNPFNSSITLVYTLNAPAHVRIDAVSLRGERIEYVQDRMQPAGEHRIRWDASRFCSGTYVIRLRVNEKILLKKCLLVR
ncbi:hypothetical protein JW948_08330 [bacterium]|nr:hypothetical protein [bacterium]